MRIPDEVLKSVVFIYNRSPKDEMYFPRGTGFLVAGRLTDEMGFSYLVTARHVVDAIAMGTDPHPYLRINDPNGGFHFMQTSRDEWISHPSDDEMVDVAVIQGWDVRAVPSDVRAWPIAGFATAEIIAERSIGSGTDLFITGLFVHHQGTERATPIVRVGNVAAMPTESIKTPLGSMGAYLIEARSIGGLSGSPVFAHLEHTPSPSGMPWVLPPVYLLGLMHGHWEVGGSASDPYEERINTGIGIVVPAVKILEVINQPELLERRERLRQDLESGKLK